MTEFKGAVSKDVIDVIDRPHELQISDLQQMQPPTELIDVSRDLNSGSASMICPARSSTQALHHGRLVLSRWDRLLGLVKSPNGRQAIAVDGGSLDVASVLAVARYVLVTILTSQVSNSGIFTRHGANVIVDRDVLERMDQSFESMKSCLAMGQTIYGMNGILPIQ